MLHGFLDRCAKVLLPGGAIGIVASDRWLFNSNADRLRELLGETLGISGLRRLNGTSALYRAKTRRTGTLPRVHPVALVLRARAMCSQELGRAPLYPGASAEAGTGQTLNDVATVRIAPWPGTKGVFVVYQDVAAMLPQEHLVPAMDTDDILHGPDVNGEAGLDEIEERLRDPRSVQWVRERAPALENGYFSVTTTLLRQLPLF